MEKKPHKQPGRHLLCKHAELKAADPFKVHQDKTFVNSLNGDGKNKKPNPQKRFYCPQISLKSINGATSRAGSS